MQHRHLDTTEWSAAAIDSVLERGDLPEWKDLFRSVETDRRLAERVLKVAAAHDLGGASILAKLLVEHLQPTLKTTGIPRARPADISH
jgi:hypothetical protein